jgi:hypothetical protein
MRTIYTDDHWENDPFLMLDRIRAVRAEQAALEALHALEKLGTLPEQIVDMRVQRAYAAFLAR